MMKRVVEYALALLFSLLPFAKQAQTVEAISRLEADSMRIGGQLVYELNLKIPSDFTVDWPVWGDTLSAGIEILAAGPLERRPVDREGNLWLRQELTITSFDEGLYYIPGAELRFSPPNDSIFFLAQTNPLMLQVHTVAIDTTSWIKPIKGPVAIPLTFREVFPWIIGLLALGLLIFLVVWYVVRRGRREVPLPVISKPVIQPHVIALNRLEEIRLQKLWQSGKVKVYHSELSETIREYIEARFGINAVEMVTDEILVAIEMLGVNEDAFSKLARALQLGDLVKFAKAEPSGLENDMCLNHLVDFVNESHGLADHGQNADENKNDVETTNG